MSSSKLHNFLREQILPLSEIDSVLPNGTIYDLGCGEGIISTLLAKNKKRKVVGVDLNLKRIPLSRQKNLEFINADIRKYKLKPANGVIISDVLHHIDYKNQKNLLKQISQKIKKGGTLVVKEIDTREFIRSALSRFWDFVFYPKDRIYYHSADELTNYLKSLGFKVEIKKASRLFPGSTTLFVCTKI